MDDPICASILIQGLSQCLPCFCFDVKNNSNLKSNLEDLDKRVKNLNDLRDQVQRRTESLKEKRDMTEADEWLKKVDSLEKSVTSVREKIAARDKGRARMAYEEWQRKSELSNQVVGLLEEVKRVQKDGNFDNLFEAKTKQ